MKNGSTLGSLWSMQRGGSLTPSFRKRMVVFSFCAVFSGAMLLFQATARAQFAPASSISPTLKIAGSNGSVIVSWQISPFDFFLECVTNLSGSDGWQRVPTPPLFVEDEASVTMPATKEQEYFRLLRPGYSYGPTRLPVFQFAIFYAVELEISPDSTMTINGPVHCSSNIFLQPFDVTLQSRVTSAQTILHTNAPLDPMQRPPGTVTYLGGRRSGVTPLTLSFDTNHNAGALREILNMPPVGESPTSLIGRERFYNKADMIVLVTDLGTTVTSGLADSFATVVPPNQWSQFLSTNNAFFNKRENKTVRAIELDVSKLRQWNTSNSVLRPTIPGGDLRIVYINDQRSQAATNQTGVRVINGQILPSRYLTVATPSPLYVKGNYNVTVSPVFPPMLGSSNTTYTGSAALIGDAITILSGAWDDANSSRALSYRMATNTTVNAALLGGIVATTTNSYSGGSENFPRFLEDWSARTLTYNGSFAALFYSEIATGAWMGTGSAIGIYNPPVRNWYFDQNFRDAVKLPSRTPLVGVLAPAGTIP